MAQPGRSHAFGLGLDLRFPVSGLAPSAVRGLPRLELSASTEDAINRGWRPGAAEALARGRDRRGRLMLTVDRLGDEHRIWARDHGLYRLVQSRTLLDCAPPRDTRPWRWQRALLGTVLPLAAVLRGYEALHASAVEIDGKAVAVVARTGGGKTSVALNLVARGAGFLCDDVLAVETSPDGEVLAHPGPGVANLRHEEARRLEAVGCGLEKLGEDAEGIRVELRRTEQPVPLERIYFLERGATVVPAVHHASGPAPILGATFNLIIRTPERLTNQLKIASRIATHVPLHRFAVPGSMTAAETARVLESHLSASR
jgi:hypothetical protein